MLSREKAAPRVSVVRKSKTRLTVTVTPEPTAKISQEPQRVVTLAGAGVSAIVMAGVLPSRCEVFASGPLCRR